MRKIILVGNWKMNPQSFNEAKNLFFKIKRGIKTKKNVEVVIAPPFVFLFPLSQISRGSISLASQNCFWKKSGAFTGEISPLMLKDLNVKYVILGHSERRIYLKETDQMIGEKMKAVWEVGLKVILCVGEKDKEDSEIMVKEQIKNAIYFSSKKKASLSNLILAYEPVWAIGTGDFCPQERAEEMLFYIKRVLFSLLGEKWKKAKVLYGGSVSPENAKSYLEVGFDGLLIGGVSLRSKSFLEIINSI